MISKFSRVGLSDDYRKTMIPMRFFKVTPSRANINLCYNCY